jgi:tripartite-type tricarboxylate transporter receptor subunit TctC
MGSRPVRGVQLWLYLLAAALPAASPYAAQTAGPGAAPITPSGPAQAYPVKPIRLVHGYASGSSLDLNARTVAQKLTEALGQQVMVDSRAGATGAIAADFVVRSPPDGYTLLATPGSALTATPYLQKVPFDPLKDLTAISSLGDFSFLLAGHPALPAHNAHGLIALAKARPGIVSFGSNGVGSAYHVAGALFASMAGVQMLHVPYRGGGATAITDLVSGRVDVMWNNPAFLLPHVQAGKLKSLGVTGRRRIPALKDVPTIAESGLPGYEISGWQGLMGPAGMAKEIVGHLHATLSSIFAARDMRALWDARGMEFAQRSPESFSARLRADYETYGHIMKQVGNRID